MQQEFIVDDCNSRLENRAIKLQKAKYKIKFFEVKLNAMIETVSKTTDLLDVQNIDINNTFAARPESESEINYEKRIAKNLLEQIYWQKYYSEELVKAHIKYMKMVPMTEYKLEDIGSMAMAVDKYTKIVPAQKQKGSYLQTPYVLIKKYFNGLSPLATPHHQDVVIDTVKFLGEALNSYKEMAKKTKGRGE